jgi:hypothetical protein
VLSLFFTSGFPRFSSRLRLKGISKAGVLDGFSITSFREIRRFVSRNAIPLNHKRDFSAFYRANEEIVRS